MYALLREYARPFGEYAYDRKEKQIQQLNLVSMVHEDCAACGSSKGGNSHQVAVHETPLPTPPAASATAIERGVETNDGKRNKRPSHSVSPLFVAEQSQQVGAASQSRFIPCVCWDTLDKSLWYNVLKFVALAAPENIFMNMYVQGCLRNDSLHDSGMPRKLRGRLKHDGRSALICEGQLPLLGIMGMTLGRLVREEYYIFIRDVSGLVEAAMLWNQSRSSYRIIDVIDYVPEHSWCVIGYDLQKWKVIGNNVNTFTCHPIPPLSRMISEIWYSFPLFQYKYCLFADIPVQSNIYQEEQFISGSFRFSTSDVAQQSIDFDEWCSNFRHLRRDLDVST